LSVADSDGNDDPVAPARVLDFASKRMRFFARALARLVLELRVMLIILNSNKTHEAQLIPIQRPAMMTGNPVELALDGSKR